jgi:hypothetical protein
MQNFADRNPSILTTGKVSDAASMYRYAVRFEHPKNAESSAADTGTDSAFTVLNAISRVLRRFRSL